MSVSYFDHKRKDLIDVLMKAGIRDTRVLEAFNKVKREMYVVPEFKRLAYDNSALPISNNQTI